MGTRLSAAYPGTNRDRQFHVERAGQRIRYLGRAVRITGLVATTRSRSIGEDPHPCLYFPIAREARGNDSLAGISLVLRTSRDPAGYAPLVRETIRKIDPTLALFDVRTMEAQLSQALSLPRAAALLFGFAGLMGLSIAAVGIYGVIASALRGEPGRSASAWR